MIKITVTIIIFFFINPVAWGQLISNCPEVIESSFQYIYGDEQNQSPPRKNGIVQTNDCGYIVIGRYGNESPFCTYIMKVDENGTIVFSKVISILGFSISPTGLIALEDDKYLMYGSALDLSNNKTHLLSVTIDFDGNILEEKTYSISNKDIFARKAVRLENGDILFLGNYKTGNLNKFYFLRVTADGDVIYSKYPSSPGSGHNYILDIHPTGDGGFIGTGFRAGWSIPVYKWDENLDLEWGKRFAASVSCEDVGEFIFSTSDGGYLIAGRTKSFGLGTCGVSSGTYVGFLSKINENGNIIWFKALSGPNTNIIFSIFPTEVNNEFIASFYDVNNIGEEQTVSFCKVNDVNGEISEIYSLDADLNEYGDIFPLQDDKYIISGYTNSISSGDYDHLLIKTDVNFNSEGCWDIEDQSDLPIMEIISVSEVDASIGYSDKTVSANDVNVDACNLQFIQKNTCNEEINTFVESYNISICNGDEYELPNGEIVDENGVYTSIIETDNCCNVLEDIVEINLTIIPSYETIIEESICDNESYQLVDGSNVTSPGDYSITIQSIEGCDSTVTVALSVLETSSFVEEVKICEGENYTLSDGTLIDESGEYFENFVSINGCDSIVTLTLSVFETLYSEESIEICEGESYILPNDSIVSIGGDYPVVEESVLGCDSIVNFVVMVNPIYDFTEELISCEGDTIVDINGSTIFNNETIEYTYSSVYGCDSVVVTNYTFLPESDTILFVNICDGEFYIAPDGSLLNLEGIYDYQLIKANGCDSIIDINLLINSSFTMNEEYIICSGDSILLPNDTFVGNDGIFSSAFETSFGCDSIIYTNISVIEHDPINEIIDLCEGDIYILPNGEEINSDREVNITFSDENNCDSLVNYTFNFYAQSVEYIESNVCFGEIVELPNGDFINESGVYESSFIDYRGCDSIVLTTIDMIDCDSCFTFPTAFSPNEDGMNDEFKMFSQCPIQNYYLAIYNRWGVNVFETNDPNKSWRGTFRGDILPTGVYVWYSEFEYLIGNKIKIGFDKGNITLIR